MSEPMATADLAPTPPAPALQQSADGDFCIPAKRMKDGSVCFYVTIEHLIEQTLLRALNRPEFRKTPVVVKEDETLTQPPPAAATVEAEPATKVPSVPIKLQLKRKYREVATGAEADISTSSACGSEAKRQELGSSPHKVTPGTSRLVEGDLSECLGNSAEPAVAAAPIAAAPIAAAGQFTIGRHDWHGAATAAAAALGSGRKTSPSSVVTSERRSSTGSISATRPPAEHRSSTSQLHGTYQPRLQPTADDLFALRDQQLLLQPPPRDDDDVALDLSAKRPAAAAMSSSSPGNMASILPLTGMAAAAQSARNHDFQQSVLAAASKELNEGSNHHQPALPSAMLLEHYAPFGHLFHHQAAAAAAGSELAAMMHGADVKDWHHFSAAATLAATRPLGYPLSSWPLSSPSPLALGMMQPPGRTLAGAAAAAAAASGRPFK